MRSSAEMKTHSIWSACGRGVSCLREAFFGIPDSHDRILAARRHEPAIVTEGHALSPGLHLEPQRHLPRGKVPERDGSTPHPDVHTVLAVRREGHPLDLQAWSERRLFPLRVDVPDLFTRLSLAPERSSRLLVRREEHAGATQVFVLAELGSISSPLGRVPKSNSARRFPREASNRAVWREWAI